MPVSIARRRVVQAFVATGATVVAGIIASFAITAATSATAVPAQATGRSARLDETRVDFAAGESEARYRSQEVLSGRGVNEAVGRTTDVAGTILFDASGAVLADRSRITVDLTTLESDSTMRDQYVRRTTLETARFPTADFVVTAAPGLPIPLPDSGSAAFELIGDLTVHGVTRPTTWQATATFAEGAVTGTATTTVLITDFGMEPPRAGPVLSIEDAIQLELDVRGTIAPTLPDLVGAPT